MTAETPAGQPLTLNDLPMAEHRDAPGAFSTTAGGSSDSTTGSR
jgi:hypothetical protein